MREEVCCWFAVEVESWGMGWERRAVVGWEEGYGWVMMMILWLWGGSVVMSSAVVMANPAGVMPVAGLAVEHEAMPPARGCADGRRGGFGW